MALELLEVGPWLIIAVSGAWLVLTGRRWFLGLPDWPKREGWPLRIFGLVYCLLAAVIAYWVIRGPFSPEGILFSYVSLSIATLVAWRKARTTEASGSRP
jgi:hypothetical protein